MSWTPWWRESIERRRDDGGIDVFDRRGDLIVSYPPEEGLPCEWERRAAIWVLALLMVVAFVVAAVVTVGTIADLDKLDSETVEVRE